MMAEKMTYESMSASGISDSAILVIATKNNQFTEIKELLETKEINVNYVDESTHAITPLHIAAESGFLKIAQLLLEHNANINIQTFEGITPLHLAVQRSHIDVAKYLIQCGADVNLSDKWGWMPSHNIAGNGYSVTVLTDLITKQTNVDAKLNDGRTALHLAADYNFHEIARILIEHGAAIEATCENDWTPLHKAASKGHIEVAKVLLEKGANTESITNKSTTPLHFAVKNNCVAMVDLLLENNAHVHALQDTHWTPLHFAAEEGHVEIVKSLLKHGADVNFINIPGTAGPLHGACRFGRSGAVKILVANGANVNATMLRNVSPLHLAVLGKDISSIQILLENGAYYDSKVVGLSTPTPMAYAHENKFEEAIHKFKSIETLFASIMKNNSSAVDRCIRMGAVLDCRSIDFESPLLYVAKMGYIRILSSLLNKRVNINITNEKNYTPLHYAAQNKHFKIVTTLLQHGAIFNIETKDEHKTPLDYANDSDTLKILTLITELFNEMSTDKHKVIEKLNAVKALTRNVISAILNAHDKDGRSLSQVALINKHRDIAEMIVIELQLCNKMESHSLKKK